MPPLFQGFYIRLADRSIFLCLGDCFFDVLHIVDFLVSCPMLGKYLIHLVDLVEKTVGDDDSFQCGVDDKAHG